MQIKILNIDTLNVKEEVFEIDQNLDGEKCVPVVVRWQLANRRGKSSARSKEMSEIRGSTKKIVRQKGSGGARHGSKRATQFVGGRTCNGPKDRDFSYTIPKKIVKKALSFVLREKILNNKLIVVEDHEKLSISTKDLSKKLSSQNLVNSLFANANVYVNFLLSLRNLSKFKYVASEALNVFDILKYDTLLVDRETFEQIKKEVA